MKARILIILGSLLCIAGSLYPQSDNMVYVKRFPGNDVGTKTTAAMATCPPNAQTTCILVIDGSLATYAAGTMPTLCARCFLQDYRAGIPSPSVGNTLYASTYGSVASADAASVALGETLVLDTPLVLSANTTISGTWRTSAKGMIVCNAHTLTFAQPLDAGHYQFLDSTCTALVTFAPLQGFADWAWWGVKADSHVTDNTAALNAFAAAVAASNIRAYISGGSGTVGVTGPVTWNGVNRVFGDGSANTVIDTTYTAGCALIGLNVISGDWGGFTLQTTSATGATTASSGFCPQNFRRSKIEDVKIDGFYKDLDTSTGTGNGFFQINTVNLWIYDFYGYGIWYHPESGIGAGSNQHLNTRFDNTHCAAACTPISAMDMATMVETTFIGTNFQNMTTSAAMVNAASDVDSITFSTVTHIEAITPGCATTAQCAFFSVRGSSHFGSWLFDAIRMNGNVFNSTNITGAKFVIVNSNSGDNYIEIRSLQTLLNTTSGVTVAVANFFEASAKAVGRIRLGHVGNMDSVVTVAAWGNFVNSAFGSYFLQRSGGDSGSSTLAAGTVTANSPQACVVGLDCYYRLSNCGSGGTVGSLSVGTITAGTSFVINSTSNTDTSKVCWVIDRAN